MRSLLTVFRYELVMQIKSLRFKGMCLLAGLFSFGLYQSGVYQQGLRPSQTFLDMDALPFYLLAVVFTGLYPMGRIRKTGIRSILMTRPFPTFILALGQTLAALFSLLFPMMILFFIPGLILKWQFEMEYPILFLVHVLLFYFIPGICCVLSITIWIRACFKNNIMALIILGFIFAGMVLLANSPLVNVSGPDGRIHNFVPMVSLFSEGYWRAIREREDNFRPSFARLDNWINFLLSAVYSCLFLLLTSYHLRRTEPQRKILGSYGRRWYHTPTFLKVACDLKIDPHVGFKSHAILFLLVCVILTKTAQPMIRPWWRNMMAKKEFGAEGAMSEKDQKDMAIRFDPNKIPDECLVNVKVIRENLVFRDGKLDSKITFTHDKSASETLAVIFPLGRWGLTLNSIMMAERRIPFLEYGGNYFIEAKEFQSLESAKEHVLTIQASLNKATMGEFTDKYVYNFSTRGYEFVNKRRKFRHGSEQTNWLFWYNKRNLWRTHLELSAPATLELADSPVPPYRVEREPDREKWKFWKKKPLATYYFDIPAMRNGTRSVVIFLQFHEKIVELDVLDIRLQFIVEKRNEKIFRELLEGAAPVIEEFFKLYKIASFEPVVIRTSWGGELQRSMNEIMRIQTRLGRNPWYKDQFLGNLEVFQKDLLSNLFYKTLTGRGPNSEGEYWGLHSFMLSNIKKGLNNRIFGIGEFQPFSLSPVSAHLDAKRAKDIENMTRVEMLDGYHIPVMQMLYHIMGRDAWIDMIAHLRVSSQNALLSIELLQDAARKAYDKPLDWFFDYWMKSGKGLPVYRVDFARARMVSSEDEEETIYQVEAQFTNEGTGGMPVPVEVNTSKGTVTGEVWIGNGETVTWNITTKALPHNVNLDPQGWILMAPAWDEKRKDWITNPRAVVEILKTEKKLM